MWHTLSVQGATATRSRLSGKKILSTVTLLVRSTRRSAQQRVTNNLLNTLEVMLLRYVLRMSSLQHCHSGYYLCKSVMMLSRLPRTPRMVVTRVIHPDTTTLVYSSILWLLESVLSLKGATPHFVSTYSSYKAFSTDSLID